MGRIVNLYNNNALEISEEQIANTFQIGNNWTWLRLGLLYQLSASSVTASIPSAEFAVGLCSGTSSLYGSAIGPTYFVGMTTKQSTTIAYAKGQSSVNPYYYASVAFPSSIGYKTGSNSFSSSGLTPYGVGYGAISSSLSGAFWLPLYIDFIKTVNNTSNQNWNIRFSYFGPDNNIRLPEYATTNTFYIQLANQTASFSGGGIPWNVNTFNVPVSESVYGPLDSINIFWNKAIPLELYDIAAYRFV